MPVTAPVHEVGHGRGKLPGVGVGSRFGGEGDGGEENVVLFFEPGQGLRVTGGLAGSGASSGRAEDYWLP